MREGIYGPASYQPGQGFLRPAENSGTDVNHLLGTNVELVQDRSELGPGDQEAIIRGVTALISDAKTGDRFSPDAIAAFQRIYNGRNGAGATPETVMNELNAVGAAINGRISPELSRDPGRRAEPIGMIGKENPDGSFSFAMMLSKNSSALAQQSCRCPDGT